jgi:hypothetical protein
VIDTKHMRFLTKWWSGTPRREPPQGFRLEDATLKYMISAEDDDKETQAMIVAMVVDQNGKDFAKLKSYMKLLIFDERCIFFHLKKGKVN